MTTRGQFLGWNSETRQEESFDFFAESSKDKDKPADEIFARHLLDGGVLSMDTFGMVGFADNFKPAERDLLKRRALEINGSDEVDFERVIRARWSAETPNRSNIVVPNNAWDLEDFNGKNPIGAWSHRTSFSGPEMIVSRWLHTGHKTSSPKSDLIGFQEFVPAEINQLASTVLGLFRFGALNAFSPGFIVGAVEFKDDDNVIIFGSKDEPNELVELSNVPVPRHADAVIFALSSGEVEIGPLRDLIELQLEVAYADPMLIMETSQLEAIAKKLGLHSTKEMVELGIEGIDSMELPGAASGQAVEIGQRQADALRTGDASEIEVDAEAWERFSSASTEGLCDAALVLIARGAGLDEESSALERLAVEPEGVVADDPASEEHAPEEVEADEPEATLVTADDFSAAFAKLTLPIVTKLETKAGRLVIPPAPKETEQ